MNRGRLIILALALASTCCSSCLVLRRHRTPRSIEQARKWAADEQVHRYYRIPQ